MKTSQESESIAYRFRTIGRDIAILWGFTFAGGFLVGLISAGEPESFHKIASLIATALSMTIGFTTVGCLAKGSRWRRLFAVAILVWVSSIINIVLGFTIMTWLLQLPIHLTWMAVGGGISYIIRRR
jgi:hypothetical protein